MIVADNAEPHDERGRVLAVTAHVSELRARLRVALERGDHDRASRIADCILDRLHG